VVPAGLAALVEANKLFWPLANKKATRRWLFLFKDLFTYGYALYEQHLVTYFPQSDWFIS
jgi:hypothetical protein